MALGVQELELGKPLYSETAGLFHPVIGTVIAYGVFNDDGPGPIEYAVMLLLSNRVANFANYAVGYFKPDINQWTGVTIHANINEATEAYANDYGMDI